MRDGHQTGMASIGKAACASQDLEAADARLKTREQVLALLSHEMRTPLNGVLGMAGLLAATPLDETQKAYLTALRESGEHLLGLVNDVLDLAKLDSGRIELELVETDVERLLQGVCELLSPRAYESGIEIAWAAPARLPVVLADDGRLRQILFNLAGNAAKLTKRGGVLLSAEAVWLDPARARLRFRVRDTGPGIAPEWQARIFEEFVQTETGARAGGAGLGLAVVKRLCDALQGEVGVDSRPGEGAEFWFEAEFAVPIPGVSGGGADGGDLRGVAVGIVSPSPIVREAARLQVEACGGRPLVGERLDAIDTAACSAVLIDAAQGASAQPLPVGTPAVVLLAPEARAGIEAFRAAGYAGYLIKPLRRASLAARVLAVQPQAQGARAGRMASSEDERAIAHLSQGARVLLAEDNPVNAMLARALLAREGCVVDSVANGVEALAALAAGRYDLVLMDMRMPEMDGPTAARALRARGDATPIIALTANTFDDDRRACLDAGMNDFLSKPLDGKALALALARWSGKDGPRPCAAEAHAA